MVKYMFELASDSDFEMLYANLKAQETISFWSTSFIRGTTLDNAIVLVDEMQNLNFHELDSIITRIGENSKILFCGDATQTDLTRTNEKNGILDFMKIIRAMEYDFSSVEFGTDDIVRSGLVKNYIVTKLGYGYVMFKHLDYLKEEVDLEAEMIEGTRFYRVPSGKMYPSITSVTSFYGRQKFVEWRKKVGNEEGDRITRLATTRGTKFHDLVEKYMLNENVDDYKPLPTTKFLFLKSFKPYLDRINNIHALEKSLYSDYLGLAGRVDCIAEYEGELAIIDFKTSKKIKPEKWIENYFVQEVGLRLHVL